jgi:hypothetical protein
MNAKACLAGYCWNVDFLCKMNCKLNSDQITRITLNNKNKIIWHKNSFSHTFSSLASIRFIENFLPVIQFRWTCKHPLIQNVQNVSISNVNNSTSCLTLSNLCFWAEYSTYALIFRANIFVFIDNLILNLLL